MYETIPLIILQGTVFKMQALCIWSNGGVGRGGVGNFSTGSVISGPIKSPAGQGVYHALNWTISFNRCVLLLLNMVAYHLIFFLLQSGYHSVLFPWLVKLVAGCVFWILKSSVIISSPFFTRLANGFWGPRKITQSAMRRYTINIYFFFLNSINIYWRNICPELNLYYITLLTLLDITLFITLLYLLD